MTDGTVEHTVVWPHAEPHAWLYRRAWALAPIPLDTPAGCQEAE